MEKIKTPHTLTIIVIIFASVLFCCIGSFLIPVITSDFSIESITRFLAILFFLSTVSLILILIVDRRIYKENVQIIDDKYQKSLESFRKDYQNKMNRKLNEVLQNTRPLYLERWCNEVATADYKNEKEVETKFIYPFIRFLGYELNDIEMQYSMKVPIGRQEVLAIADFVIFNPKTHVPLIVIEAKPPTQSLNTDVQNQARSYAFSMNAPYYIITNGISLSLYKRDVYQDNRLLAIDIKNLQNQWNKVDEILGTKSSVFNS